MPQIFPVETDGAGVVYWNHWSPGDRIGWCATGSKSLTTKSWFCGKKNELVDLMSW